MFIDAALIGIGLWILGVPLVFALTVLIFLGGFVPFVGATITGLIAVLVAFADDGWVTAVDCARDRPWRPVPRGELLAADHSEPHGRPASGRDPARSGRRRNTIRHHRRLPRGASHRRRLRGRLLATAGTGAIVRSSPARSGSRRDQHWMRGDGQPTLLLGRFLHRRRIRDARDPTVGAAREDRVRLPYTATGGAPTRGGRFPQPRGKTYQARWATTMTQ